MQIEYNATGTRGVYGNRIALDAVRLRSTDVDVAWALRSVMAPEHAGTAE